MLEKRSLKLDLLALCLLTVVVFLALALVTYDPADRVAAPIAPFDALYEPDSLVYPPNAQIRNACGPWGVRVADLLLTKLGVGAFYLVGTLAAVDVLLLRRQAVDMPLLRAIGWIASLFGLTTAASMLFPGLTPGPVIGSGGYLGALGAAMLETYFATVGGVIICCSLILAGLLLCTDYAMLTIGRLFLRATIVAPARCLGRCAARAKPKAAGNYESSAGQGVEAAEEEELPIRIGGRKRLEAETADESDQLNEAEQEALEQAQADIDEATQDPDQAEDVEPASSRELIVKGKVQRVRKDQGSNGPPPRVRKREKTEREQVIAQLNDAVAGDEPHEYELPSLDLLAEGDELCFDEQTREVRRKAKILEKTFHDFGFRVKVVEIETGPVIAQYEVELEAGLRLSRITGLAEDLAIALRVPSVRIVAPIPGKNTVGIEVPNEARQVVRLREVIEESSGKVHTMRIPIFLGKDVSGSPLTVDLSTMPHLLIAGRTGTGKSVCLNAIISSMLMTRRPDEVRMLMIDPKMVELIGYGRLPHLMHPVVTDMRKAEAILAWAVEKMEERYALLAKAGVRHISSYNQLGKEELIRRLEPETDEEADNLPDHLPFIVIVADEIADLMMTAGKEVEQHIIRLAQKSRAVGIHLILATQKPTVDVITGLIKSNLPARIAFQVASRTDSRVVLDEMGAEKLLGNGDLLFLWPGTSTLLRGQGTYLSDDEINSIVASVSTHEQNFVNELVNMKVEDPAEGGLPGPLKKRDDLYASAVEVVVQEGRGSVSLLQRSLGIGYGRAARLIDFMAEDGIVGPYAGSQAREVQITMDDWRQMQGYEEETDGGRPTANSVAQAPPKPRRSNKIRPDEDWDTPIVAHTAVDGQSDGEAADHKEAYNDEDEEEYEEEYEEGYEGEYDEEYEYEEEQEKEQEEQYADEPPIDVEATDDEQNTCSRTTSTASATGANLRRPVSRN